MIKEDITEDTAVTAELRALIQAHFNTADERVESVYETHFATFKPIVRRHWRHKRDIPGDLLALPRAAVALIRRRPLQRRSGKERELQHIIEHELLDIPSLQNQLSAYCQQQLKHYDEQLAELHLNPEQQQAYQEYVEHQLRRLHLPNEGVREGLMAISLILAGRALGDKAILSSAASVGGTLASSAYISQQGWWASIWASWFGAPAWVTWVGVSSGILSVLLLTPIMSPGIEWGMNRWRARKILTQAVAQAEERILAKDGLLLSSQLGSFLQLLPDLAQFLSKLR